MSPKTVVSPPGNVPFRERGPEASWFSRFRTWQGTPASGGPLLGKAVKALSPSICQAEARSRSVLLLPEQNPRSGGRREGRLRAPSRNMIRRGVRVMGLFWTYLRNQIDFKPKGRKASREVVRFLREHGFEYRSVEIWMGLTPPGGPLLPDLFPSGRGALPLPGRPAPSRGVGAIPPSAGPDRLSGLRCPAGRLLRPLRRDRGPRGWLLPLLQMM